MTKIYILDRFHPAALTLLEEQKTFTCTNVKTLQIDASMTDAEALIMRSTTKIDKEALELLPQLKYLVTATSGFDHIDYNACAEKNIFCDYCPEANAASAAELTFAHLLHLSRHLQAANDAVRSFQWKQTTPVGNELSEKKILIVGLGRIGKRVAKIAAAFNMQVHFYDPYVISQADYKKESDLHSAIKAADIISLHTPKSKKTSPLLDATFADAFNEGQILLNVARGDAISENLIQSCLEKNIKLGFDVYANEPIKQESTLLTAQNISLSPHIGAYTEEAFEKASLQAAHKLIAFFSGNAEKASIPPNAAWVQDVES